MANLKISILYCAVALLDSFKLKYQSTQCLKLNHKYNTFL
ncbi:hypothetical protein LLB_3162 [Legionella longbeachae D-4968]|nr:hypothetical protein LLB_3162 [Legionella longbeachae D-4968]